MDSTASVLNTENWNPDLPGISFRHARKSFWTTLRFPITLLHCAKLHDSHRRVQERDFSDVGASRNVMAGASVKKSTVCVIVNATIVRLVSISDNMNFFHWYECLRFV